MNRLAYLAFVAVLAAGPAGALADTVQLAAGTDATPRVGAVAREEVIDARGIHASGAEEALRHGLAVFANETIVTGKDGSTTLVFLDDTSLEVGGSSRVLLDRFVFDPSVSHGGAALRLGKGAFRLIGGTASHNLTVATPTMAIIVRGTDLAVFVLGDGTTEVNLWEGTVDAFTGGANAGRFRLGAGQALRVGADGSATRGEARPQGIAIDVPADLAALDTADEADEADEALAEEDDEDAEEADGDEADEGEDEAEGEEGDEGDGDDGGETEGADGGDGGGGDGGGGGD